jgi:eukaryotic-like serine/threonine-protein kinase
MLAQTPCVLFGTATNRRRRYAASVSMSLSAGTRVGPYEVQSAIGAGAMGEVYRARDTKLNRDVAIKVLRPAVANGPDRLARYSREAHVLASLNHPNIAQIYGIEDADGAKALVLELVEGEDLVQRIARGPLPLDEALPIARQIAGALEAAHEQGIIHRDLKPANIKVRPDGTVKVLDFGLAKAMDLAPSSPAAAALADSPTITSAEAMTGAEILGTAGYMSPEQSRGRSVDAHTDLWAFGCVLYEMLTGRRAFPGESVTDTLSAVISKDPAWEALPQATPAPVHRLLRRCLMKDRKQRLASASDARLDIEDALSPTVPTTTASAPHPRRPAALMLSLGLGVALIAAVGVYLFGTSASREETAPAAVTRFVIQPPPGTQIVGGHREIAVSADGRQVAFIAQGTADQHIYVRRLDELESHEVADTEGARDLAFSPDGRWLVFHAGSNIRKVSLSGGPSTVLADAAHSHGLAWRPTEDAIYFARNPSDAIWKVSAGGGNPVAVTHLDKAHGERSHEWPVFSLDGRTLLFSVNTNSADLGEEEISLLDLGTGARQNVRTGGDAVGLTDTHELMLVREHSLMGATYDSIRHALPSGDRELVAGVLRGTGGSTAALSISGTLAYVPSPDLKRRSLVWIAADGTQTDAKFGQRQFRAVNLSVDGRRLAVVSTDHDGTAWDVGDSSGGALTPVGASQGRTAETQWNPDGNSLAVADSHNGRLVQLSVLGGHAGETLLADGAVNLPEQWTPDGRGLIFNRRESETGQRSICLLSLDSSPAKWSVIVDGRQVDGKRSVVRMASLSSDGRWLAYESNESGPFEIYVQAYPLAAGRLKVSRAGGTKARWAKRSDRLYFISGSTLMVSTVTAHPDLRSDAPRPVVNEPLLAQDGAIRQYDVAPDDRILAIKEDDSVRSDHIIVVQNWLSEARALLSAPHK